MLGTQNPRPYLNHWKWPTFNKQWEKSWSAKAPKIYTFWKLDSRALSFSLRLFALGHSLFGNKEEKAPTFRRPPHANQRRAAPPPLDADWIWPWTPADSSRLTAQWTSVVIDDWWMLCRHACLWRLQLRLPPALNNHAVGRADKYFVYLRHICAQFVDAAACSILFPTITDGRFWRPTFQWTRTN